MDAMMHDAPRPTGRPRRTMALLALAACLLGLTMTPALARPIEKDLIERYGLKIKLDIPGYTVIDEVWPRSPAAQAGLRGGDLILQIDGQGTYDRHWHIVQSAFHGKVQSAVAMVVLSDGQAQPRRVILLSQDIAYALRFNSVNHHPERTWWPVTPLGDAQARQTIRQSDSLRQEVAQQALRLADAPTRHQLQQHLADSLTRAMDHHALATLADQVHAPSLRARMRLQRLGVALFLRCESYVTHELRREAARLWAIEHDAACEAQLWRALAALIHLRDEAHLEMFFEQAAPTGRQLMALAMACDLAAGHDAVSLLHQLDHPDDTHHPALKAVAVDRTDQLIRQLALTGPIIELALAQPGVTPTPAARRLRQMLALGKLHDALQAGDTQAAQAITTALLSHDTPTQRADDDTLLSAMSLHIKADDLPAAQAMLDRWPAVPDNTASAADVQRLTRGQAALHLAVLAITGRYVTEGNRMLQDVEDPALQLEGIAQVARAYQRRGLVAGARRRAGQAQPMLERQPIGDGRDQALARWTALALSLGQTDLAAQAALGITTGPARQRALLDVATARLHRGEMSAAKPLLHTAMALSPQTPAETLPNSIQAQFAIALALAGDHADAARVIQPLPAGPDKAMALLTLGATWLSQDDMETARPFVLAAAELAKQHDLPWSWVRALAWRQAQAGHGSAVRHWAGALPPPARSAAWIGLADQMLNAAEFSHHVPPSPFLQ